MDLLFDQIVTEGKANVRACVENMRSRMNGMVKNAVSSPQNRILNRYLFRHPYI